MSITNRNIDRKMGSSTGLNIELQYIIFNAPAVTTNGAIVQAADFPQVVGAETELTIQAGAAALLAAHPRTLGCTVSTDADGDVFADFFFRGTNRWDETVEEWVRNVTLALSPVTTVNHYKTLTYAKVRNVSAAATDAGDQVRVDTGPALGLPYKVGALTDLTILEGEIEGGVGVGVDAMTAMTILAWGGGGGAGGIPDTGECTVNLLTQTFYPSVAPDGTIDYVVNTRSTLGRYPNT